MKVYIVWYAETIRRIFKEYDNAVNFAIDDILDTVQGKHLCGNGHIWYDMNDYIEAIKDTFDNDEYFEDFFIEERDIEDM